MVRARIAGLWLDAASFLLSTQHSGATVLINHLFTGPEASGKTTLALSLIAEAQQRGGTCAFIDAEHALDGEYARRLGVVDDQLYVAQPDCGEQVSGWGVN